MFSLTPPATHNRQSAPSRTGAATDGQLLIIVLLNTQFSESGTHYSVGAISPLSKKKKKHQKKEGEIRQKKEEKAKLESKKWVKNRASHAEAEEE